MLLKAVAGDRLEALYVVALSTGMPQGELLGLRWSDVDFMSGTVRIANALQRIDGEYRLVETKTSRSRERSTCQRLRSRRSGDTVNCHASERLCRSRITSSLTMNTYSHVMPVLQQETAERMNALLTAT